MVDSTMIASQLQRLGFPDVLLWLLSFALVFGIMSQVELPKSRAARGIISIGIASLVMLTAPANLITFLSTVSSGLVLVVVAILLLVSFTEVAGLNKVEDVFIGKDEKGNPKFKKEKVNLLSKYSTFSIIAFLLIAIMIFLGACGWQLLGFGDLTLKGIGSQSMIGIIFLAAVMIGVLWMIAESGKKD
jgi:hypothetical protein